MPYIIIILLAKLEIGQKLNEFLVVSLQVIQPLKMRGIPPAITL